MDLKVIIAIISVGMTIAGYAHYFRDIFAGKTKPHAYTWLVWASLTTIAFFGQISDNAGPGAWITAVTAATSFIIFGLALQRGEKEVTRSDKLFLGASLFAVVPWLLTDDPLISIILVTVIDFLGFLPTIRKSIHKPYEETLATYFLSGLKFVLAIIALENYTVVTWLYPASLVLANWAFIGLLIVRRKQIDEHKEKK